MLDTSAPEMNDAMVVLNALGFVDAMPTSGPKHFMPSRTEAVSDGVGRIDGARVGLAVGSSVVGRGVGGSNGLGVGFAEGRLVECTDGAGEGSFGMDDGCGVGSPGNDEGCCVGRRVGEGGAGLGVGEEKGWGVEDDDG